MGVLEWGIVITIGSVILTNLRVFFKLWRLWKIKRNLGIDLLTGVITQKLMQPFTVALILADLAIVYGNYYWVRTFDIGNSLWMGSWAVVTYGSLIIPSVIVLLFREVQSKKRDIDEALNHVDIPRGVLEFYWEARKLVNDTPIYVLAETAYMSEEDRLKIRNMSKRVGIPERVFLYDDIPLLNGLEAYLERSTPYVTKPDEISGAVVRYTENQLPFLTGVVNTLKDKEVLKTISSESGNGYFMEMVMQYEEVIAGLESTKSLLEEPAPVNRTRARRVI